MKNEFFKALQKWQKEGRRSVKIEFDSLSSISPRTYIYDYNAATGMIIEEGDKLPEAADFKAAKIAELKKALEEAEEK